MRHALCMIDVCFNTISVGTKKKEILIRQSHFYFDLFKMSVSDLLFIFL